jgi:uncharacterized protein involved in exopolysaccharide biosynthesis
MTHDDLRFYSYRFVRRLPLMTAIGAMIGAAGLAYVLSLPSFYEATGTILVKSPEIPATLAPTTESIGALARLQVMQQELLTYDALLALAKQHNLYQDAEVMSSDSLVADLRARIALSPVFFGGNQNALGFSVSFTAAEPELAAQVTNDLIQTILQRDLNERASRAAVAVSFFEDVVAKLGKELAAIEGRVQAYRTEHLQALPDTLEFRRLLQINLRDRLLALEREKNSLQTQRANYIQFYRSTAPLAVGASFPPEQRQLEELKQALASQRMVFSEDSLAIRSLKSQIAEAEEKLGSVSIVAPGVEDTPTRDMQLADMDARLEAISLERESLQRNDTDLTNSIAATPANEAALSALEREYDDARTLYTSAAARLADASTGEQIESGLKGERLILMEAARPPETPSGPRRFPLALGVAAAALAAALGAAFLLELLDRKIQRAADVERALGIEVLANIPNIAVRPPIRFKLPSLLHGMGTVRS